MWKISILFIATILAYLYVNSVLAFLLLAMFIFTIRKYQQEKSMKQKVRDYIPPKGPSWSDQKRFLVILNPHGGNGAAVNIYKRVVEPMFTRAKLKFEIRKTERAGHAGQMCSELVTNNSDFDVIVCISGDGLIHECLNGFASSCTSESHFKSVLQRISLAVIPAGSCNGVAMSVGSGEAFNATANVISGLPQPIDLLSVKQSSGQTYWDVHFFCWAAFSDHDYLIEGPLRSLGVTLKKIVAPLIVIGRLRKYSAVVDIVPIEMTAEQRKLKGYSDPSLLPDSQNTTDQHQMKRIKGNFWCFALGNLSWGGTDTRPTPYVGNCEGACDLLIGRKNLSRWTAAQLLLKMENGKHVFEPEMEVYKVSKIHLNTNDLTSHMQCSGEEIPCGPVTLQAHKGALRMILP